MPINFNKALYEYKNYQEDKSMEEFNMDEMEIKYKLFLLMMNMIVLVIVYYVVYSIIGYAVIVPIIFHILHWWMSK